MYKTCQLHLDVVGINNLFCSSVRHKDIDRLLMADNKIKKIQFFKICHDTDIMSIDKFCSYFGFHTATIEDRIEHSLIQTNY